MRKNFFLKNLELKNPEKGPGPFLRVFLDPFSGFFGPFLRIFWTLFTVFFGPILRVF